MKKKIEKVNSPSSFSSIFWQRIHNNPLSLRLYTQSEGETPIKWKSIEIISLRDNLESERGKGVEES